MEWLLLERKAIFTHSIALQGGEGVTHVKVTLHLSRNSHSQIIKKLFYKQEIGCTSPIMKILFHKRLLQHTLFFNEDEDDSVEEGGSSLIIGTRMKKN